MNEVRERKADKIKREMKLTGRNLSNDTMKLHELCSEKGASIWLTSLPLKKCESRVKINSMIQSASVIIFILTKYPENMRVARTTMSVTVSLLNGEGFGNIRHDVVRDTFADLISEIKLEKGATFVICPIFLST